ncbi:MAG: NAD(P)/FAD-dependent oxidoreductase [Reyranellaceae bacterium]
MRRQPSICIIGAGPGGIAAAIMLQRRGLTRFTLFDRASGPGGTWYHNRYPGAACDIQSRLYSFSFKPKYDWSRINAPQAEILDYLAETAREHGLLPHCRFGTGVAELRWIDDRRQWSVTTDAGETVGFDVVISCVGLLNDPHWPSLPGLDLFRGIVMHSARWQDVDLTHRRVAVIGTGSSSAQIVKSIAPRAGHLRVYQREPGWVIPNDDRAVSPEESRWLRTHPWRTRLERWKQFWQRERLASVVVPGSKVHRARTEACLAWLDRSVRDPTIRAALTPDYPFNCKRPVRDPDYLATFNRDNVELVSRPVVAFTEHGVVADDGIERPADVVVMATGFKAASFLSTLRVTGRDGADLHGRWEALAGPEAFLGLCHHGFPNFFTFYGPNSNSATGSILFILECQAAYAAAAIARMARRGWTSVEVGAAVQRRYNAWLQRKASRTTWTTGCHNYYAAPSGKIVTNWPFSMVIYWLLLKLLRVGWPFLFTTRGDGERREGA